jgi:hypothetical protein
MYQHLSSTCKPWKCALAESTVILKFIESGMKVTETMLKRIPVSPINEKSLVKAWSEIIQQRVELCIDKSITSEFMDYDNEECEKIALDNASNFLKWLQELNPSYRQLIHTLDLTNIAFTPDMRASILTLLPNLQALTLSDKMALEAFKIQGEEIRTIFTFCPHLEHFYANNRLIDKALAARPLSIFLF